MTEFRWDGTLSRTVTQWARDGVSDRPVPLGAFLFLTGVAFSFVWSGDILHFYGVYLPLGALLLGVGNRRLWVAAILCATAFLGLVITLDYEAGWDWKTLDYDGFWSPGGAVRRILFNGFHPVFPWLGFLFVGMWLSRGALTRPEARRRVLARAAVVAVAAEALSRGLLFAAEGSMDPEFAGALLGTTPMPPLPLYQVAAGATAVAVVCACVELIERFRGARWIAPLAHTGQLALTLYVAHVMVGMGALEAAGRLEDRTLPFSLTCALTFSAGAVVFAHLWRRRFRRGPLEALMRRLTR